MEENKSEFLEAIRESDRLNKEDEQRYLKACKEFTEFIKSSGCRQVEVDDEQ